MKIQNNQFLSLEQLQERYLNQNRQVTESLTQNRNSLSFQDILSLKTEDTQVGDTETDDTESDSQA